MWDENKIDKRLRGLTYPGTGEDLGFHVTPCYLCQRPLGGDRCELTHKDGVEAICTDCVYYVNYGEVPDDET